MKPKNPNQTVRQRQQHGSNYHYIQEKYDDISLISIYHQQEQSTTSIGPPPNGRNWLRNSDKSSSWCRVLWPGETLYIGGEGKKEIQKI